MGLKVAFHAENELAMTHLLTAIPEIRSLVRTDPEAVTAMTRWLDTHTKPAGNQTPAHTQNGKPRKRRVTV